MSSTTRISLEQYDEMIRQGIFLPREEHRVELIYGEISPMSPIGPIHDWVVDLLAEWSILTPPQGAARVRVKGSFGICELDSAPLPDLAWLRKQDYSREDRVPQDVLLVIEVADSSLAKDRGIKAELYAKAGIADYWIVNLPERRVEVRREPRDAKYRRLEIFGMGQEVSPLALPEVTLRVSDLFTTE